MDRAPPLKKPYDECQDDPTACYRQIAVDSLVLMGMYVAGMYAADGRMPTPQTMATFLGLFVGSSVFLRFLELDYADALSRGAAIAVAAKFIGVLGR